MQQPDQGASGPYLQAAFFCERLLEEADGVYSAIRIVDTIAAAVPEKTSQPEWVPVAVNLTLFITFKAGQARGAYDLTVVMDPPAGASPKDPDERHTQTILFDGRDDHGITIIMPIAMQVDQNGVYWFAVYLGDRLMTRLPLRVDAPGQTRWARPQ